MHLFHHLSKIKDLEKLGVRPVKSLWHIEKATQSDYIAPGLLSLLCTIVPLKVLPGGSVGKESACNAEDLGLIPGMGRSPEEGKGYPLQYSGLENSMACVVHGVAKIWTRLSNFHFTSWGCLRPNIRRHSMVMSVLWGQEVKTFTGPDYDSVYSDYGSLLLPSFSDQQR